MRFLKILFWILIGVLIAAFVIYNEAERVDIALWGNLVADISLPVLLVGVLLIGFLPMFLAFHTMRWRMRARVTTLERTIDDLRAQLNVASAPRPDSEPGDIDTTSETSLDPSTPPTSPVDPVAVADVAPTPRARRSKTPAPEGTPTLPLEGEQP